MIDSPSSSVAFSRGPWQSLPQFLGALVLEDIIVKLVCRDDCFLTDIAHLALELSQNGQIVDKVNLLSRKAIPGVWNADQRLILQEVTGDFNFSVWIQFDENDRQLISSIELDGTELYNKIGTEHKIPLLPHENYPDMVLWTKISTIEKLVEDTQDLISEMMNLISETINQLSGSKEGDTRRQFQNMKPLLGWFQGITHCYLLSYAIWEHVSVADSNNLDV
ncbi:hypothetical protein CPB86DRAFT_830641 [Serendipita vermifera]|nr:hypothetical protein CPB86DRAFT_830641 [Serendipita vermifera]